MLSVYAVPLTVARSVPSRYTFTDAVGALLQLKFACCKPLVLKPVAVSENAATGVYVTVTVNEQVAV